MLGLATKLLMLLWSVGLANGQVSFICNNYKNQASCDGSQASDGLCGWGLFGCSAVQPLPSPVVAPVTAPPITCPPYTAEASCVYNPCTISQVCFANIAAQCVINPCIGEFEYLGAILHTPCSAVFVDIEALEVVNCNVKEVVREADPDAVRPGAGAVETKSVVGEAPNTDIIDADADADATQSVSGPTLGLPSVAPSPSPVVSVVDQNTPSVGLPLTMPSLSVGTSEVEETSEVAVGKTPLSALSNLNDLVDTAPAVEEEDDN